MCVEVVDYLFPLVLICNLENYIPRACISLYGIASTGKGVMPKLGRKPSINEEDRRATYNISVQPATDSDSVLSTFEGESKQFIPVCRNTILDF